MTRRFLSVLAALALWAAPVLAQPQGATPEPSYRDRLVQLSQVLGGAHYLRILCSGLSDQRWRETMRDVIRHEPHYAMQMVEGFNRGYREEEARFADCDDGAQAMEAELRGQGTRLAGALRARPQQ